MRDKLKKDPFELVLYAYPEHKFRIFLVTFDSELDVIHDLKYEKKKDWLNPKRNGIPIIDKCFIDLDEVKYSDFLKFFMYLSDKNTIEICCLKNDPCDICAELVKKMN